MSEICRSGIGGGWAIDARLGRVTRKHDDIDLTFPGERRGELEAIVEMLGGRVMEELDYGFLAEIGDELLDCEPAWWADEAYEIAEAPQGSCPEAAEGVIAGRPVRCNSWEAIIWDYFYYADEVPPVDWPTKHIESYRLACTSLGAEKVEVLRAAFQVAICGLTIRQADAASRRGLTQVLNIMREAVIAEVSTQLSEVVGVIERHLEPTLLAVHLYGSAVDGGLKPHSDIDLLVTVTVRLDETTRRALINDLLETSASPERARFSAL